MLPISSTLTVQPAASHQLPEQLAALLVEIGQRQALAAALGRRADLRHLHQGIPEPRPVDAHIRQVSHRPQLQHTFVNAIIGLTKWSNGVTLGESAHQFGAVAAIRSVRLCESVRNREARHSGEAYGAAQTKTDHPRGERTRASRSGRVDLRRAGIRRRDDRGDRAARRRAEGQPALLFPDQGGALPRR